MQFTDYEIKCELDRMIGRLSHADPLRPIEFRVIYDPLNTGGKRFHLRAEMPGIHVTTGKRVPIHAQVPLEFAGNYEEEVRHKATYVAGKLLRHELVEWLRFDGALIEEPH